MCTDEECKKTGFVDRCEQGCHHCDECRLPCYTYHEEDCSKAALIPCDNRDGRAGYGSWADGRKLCEECFEAMGPDPRYTPEQNEKNRLNKIENKRLKELRKLNPLTEEELAEARKVLDDIFGPTDM